MAIDEFRYIQYPDPFLQPSGGQFLLYDLLVYFNKSDP